MTRTVHAVAAALVLCSLAIVAPASGSRVAAQARPSSWLTPVAYSGACRRDSDRRAACQLVGGFFRAVNSGRYGAACALLGRRLLDETGGIGCPALIRSGQSHPWGIVNARATASGVDVMVVLGQSELAHERMRLWKASVGIESGSLRVLATQLLR